MEIDGISTDVIRELHAGDLSRLRTRFAWTLAAFVAVLIVWATLDGEVGSVFFVLVGIVLLFTARALFDVIRHKRIDPVAQLPELVAAGERAKVTSSAHTERMGRHPPRITYALIGSVVVVYLLQLVISRTTTQAVFAAGLVKPLVNMGQWWRLVSGTYLHASLMHVWMNMAALAALGRLMEAYAPRWRLPLVYAAAAVGGSVASWQLMPNTSSIGASGAILGLAGYLAFASWRRPSDVPPSIGRQALMTCALTGFIGALGFQFIDNAAHAGGAIAGALVAWMTMPREEPGFEAAATPTLDAIGMIAAALILVGAIGTSYKIVKAGASEFDANGSADVVTPIASARLSFQKTDIGTDVVIENLSDKTIEAYMLVLRVSGVPKYEQWRDDCCLNVPATIGHGIAPHSQVVNHVALSNTDLSATSGATLSLVMFDDRSFEGSRNSRNKIVAERRTVLSDIDFWLKDLDETLTLRVADVAPHLRSKIDERARAADTSRRSITVLGIPRLMQVAEQRPEDYPSAVEATKQTLTAQRDALITRLQR